MDYILFTSSKRVITFLLHLNSGVSGRPCVIVCCPSNVFFYLRIWPTRITQKLETLKIQTNQITQYNTIWRSEHCSTVSILWVCPCLLLWNLISVCIMYQQLPEADELMKIVCHYKYECSLFSVIVVDFFLHLESHNWWALMSMYTYHQKPHTLHVNIPMNIHVSAYESFIRMCRIWNRPSLHNMLLVVLFIIFIETTITNLALAHLL